MTIKGSFILEHPHVKAVFGLQVQSKLVFEMAVFRKFKGPNIKYSHRDPQKALPYSERRHFGPGVYAVALLKNPPKNKHTTGHPKSTAKSRIWGTETPEPIATKFCMPAAVQDVITPAIFCEDRLRGFGVAIEGSNFGLFH